MPRAARASTPERAANEERDLSRPIVAGVQINAYPYSFVDDDGQLKGFAIDISNAIARVMGLHIEHHQTVANPELLQSGQVDLFPLLAETDARRKLADFSIPLLRLEPVVVVRRGDPKLRHLSDLAGKRVAVGLQGSTGHEYVTRMHPAAIALHIEGPDALSMIARGTLDAALVSRLTAESEFEHQNIHVLEILPERISGFDVRRCIAVRRGDALLLARMNEGLAILQRTGEFDEIRARWLGRYDRRTFTWRELLGSLAGILLIAAGAITLTQLQKRKLSRRVVKQSDELAEQRSLVSVLFDNHPLAT